MKFLSLLTICALAFGGVPRSWGADGDASVEARKVALDLAGAFANEGFKLRDGHWSGALPDGKPAVIAVNLYAGNQYWFSVGASEPGKKFSVAVFDETGKPLPVDEFADDDKVAAGLAPTMSGQYFVSISPAEAVASAYCLVYSYQ